MNNKSHSSPLENRSLITRDDFIKKAIRYGLLTLLTIVSYVLWGRVAIGKNCSGCPENGSCKGRSDCNKY